jgi:N-acetylneuraminic acid mutarotase
LVCDAAGRASLTFGEGPQQTNYPVPDSIAAAEIFALSGDAAPVRLEMNRLSGDDFQGLRSAGPIDPRTTLATRVTYGIHHGAKLDYYAVHLADIAAAEAVTKVLQRGGHDLTAQLDHAGGAVTVAVTWQGKPLADTEVSLFDAAGDAMDVATTDSDGMVRLSPDTDAEAALGGERCGIMLGHKTDVSGKMPDGTSFDSSSHYLTVTFSWPESDRPTAADDDLAPLPVAVTSFGAARLGDSIYLYGGHTGDAHAYWDQSQSNGLWKLQLNPPATEWKQIATGDRLQGLAMVAHDQRLIMIGGFQAMNAEGEPQDLHSRDTVRAFDPATGQWSELPSLPESRSSHDAAIVGDTIYVVGGWKLDGDNETVWHKTAWSLDLSADQPQWKAIAAPPFRRRALATVAHQGKVFVIGGMNAEGGPTRDVAVFDPQSNAWSEVEPIAGESPMAGFGASAWSIDGQLVVTTYEGSLQIWDEAKQSWRQVGETDDARFFHRLLPLDQGRLVSVGGANMESGKFLTPEIISLDPNS